MKKIILACVLTTGLCFGSEEPAKGKQQPQTSNTVLPQQRSTLFGFEKQDVNAFFGRYKAFFFSAGLISFGNCFKSRRKFSIPFTLLCAGITLKQEKIVDLANSMYELGRNVIDEIKDQTNSFTKHINDRAIQRQSKNDSENKK